MGRLETIKSGGKRVYGLIKEIFRTGAEISQALRFLESHSDRNSRVGRRIRKITENDNF